MGNFIHYFILIDCMTYFNCLVDDCACGPWYVFELIIPTKTVYSLPHFNKPKLINNNDFIGMAR
jgi:hypothetical protein